MSSATRTCMSTRQGARTSWRVDTLRPADSCSLVIMADAASRPRPTRCARRCPTSRTTSIAAIAREVPGLRARRWRAASARSCASASRSRSTASSTCSAAPAPSPASARDTYLRLGAGEYRAGPTLDALLAAYRVGARLAWRRFVEAGTQRRLPARRALRPRRGDVRLHRRDLRRVRGGVRRGAVRGGGRVPAPPARAVRLLVQEPPAAEEAVRTAAQAAGWALPRLVAAVVAGEAEQPEARGDDASDRASCDGIAARLARRLGPGAVGAAVGGLAVVMMPDPEGPGRRKALETALAASSPRSARRWRGRRRREPAPRRGRVPARRAGPARRRRAAAAAGRPAPPRAARLRASAAGQSRARLVVADEHLPALLLAAEPALAADLARSRLAPLDALAAGPRERLVATLRAWLDRPGQVQAVAADARRPPADRALPAQAAARAVRGAAGGPGGALRARAALRAADGVRY